MSAKERLLASVDADLVVVAEVAQGRADSVSAWVNDALRLKAAHDQRLRAIDEFVAAFEAEHGEITEAQMREAARRARGRAVVVRGEPTAGRKGGPESAGQLEVLVVLDAGAFVVVERGDRDMGADQAGTPGRPGADKPRRGGRQVWRGGPGGKSRVPMAGRSGHRRAG